MNARVLLGSLAAVVLFFFGTVFALASSAEDANPFRLVVAAVLFVAGLATLTALYLFTRKRPEIVQRIEFSGEMKTVQIKCPNCGASIEPKEIKIVDGVPYATCRYCGHTVEVAEEPKW